MERYGIVGFALGHRKNDPGISNRALARVVERLMNEKSDLIATIVLQHEILDCMPFCPDPECLENHRVFPVKEHGTSGQYLDSEEVMRQAAEHFNNVYVKKIFIVAQPFLHLHKCIKLAELAGFEPIVPKNMRIPFDGKSEQWQARGHIQLLTYAILQKFFGWRGK